MTAAYRLRGLGWFACGVVVVLAFYIVSLHVAAERARVVALDREIKNTRIELRRLDTEFNTRASVVKLARLNAEKLGLAVPASSQYVSDAAGLASIDLDGDSGPRMPGDQIRTAAYFVPATQPGSVPSAKSASPTTAPAGVAAQASAVRVAAADTLPRTALNAAALPNGPGTGMARAGMAAATVTRANATAKLPRLAMLDRKLLSDATLGDLVAGANAEARGLR